MLRKGTANLLLLLSLLMALLLSSGLARAQTEPPSNLHHNDITNVSYCDWSLEAVEKDEPGCCEPGGRCYQNQCCTHYGHSMGAAVIESQQYTDEAPYRNEWIASPIVIYTSAEMRTHYRPPIA
ncbi:TPA: hypothetical protein ACGUVV_001496 [Vibrio vulnificus]|uniref:hypothetical protein n=2 Tax=Vibrio vulnificus TaxID=672 RepID=UPI0010294EB8|nr:hypothetical protein [Vibrio vulnificus]EGR0111005.1 hypothetical protein [Vibrio vulnificus]EID4390464.1 hypothetical protein [Vibrio vulnificus]EIF5018289.1 hypothetical protein [Vibrio vulnificus]EIO2324061.1 hypothetical protein [Vibrio vulnificus]EIO4069189.1 hypothetical protein [Vibrio vulnificus]